MYMFTTFFFFFLEEMLLHFRLFSCYLCLLTLFVITFNQVIQFIFDAKLEM